MAKEVKNGSVTVHYTIYEHEVGDELMFDWVASNGDESSALFATAAWAERDILMRLGG